jgi:hypothetical protein
MEYFSKTIYDDKWTFYIVDDDDDVIADEGNEAETDFDKREIYFRKEGVKLVTVKHELFHLFFSYTFTDTANLEQIQVEEIACEIYSHQSEKIDALSKEVYEELVKLRDSK